MTRPACRAGLLVIGTAWATHPRSVLAVHLPLIVAAGTGTAAFVAFLVFYGVRSALTWAVYLRKRPAAPAAETGAGTEARARSALSCAEV